jgi:branched-chain amino acid transport system permease protein
MNISLFFQILLNGLMSGGIYALIASGFTLVLGVVKIFNFAQSQFYMLGAFVTFYLVSAAGVPYPVAILVALVAMAILGVLFHFALIQPTMPYGFFHTMLITTLFSTIVTQTTFLTFGYQAKFILQVIPGSLMVGELSFNWGKLLATACSIIVMVVLYYFMKTRMGTAMLAAAENIDVASLQGINAKQIFWVTMAVACGLCGLAGGIILPILGATDIMGTKAFLPAILVVIIGGTGSMSGALIAAFLIGIVDSFAFYFVGSLDLLVVFGFTAVLVYFRPGGLMGKPLPIPGE